MATTITIDLGGETPTILTPRFVLGWDTSVTSGYILHWPINGNGFPVRTWYPGKPRHGTLRVYWDSYEEAVACVDAHAITAVRAFLSDPVLGSLYYIPSGETRLSADNAGGTAWSVYVDYQEVEST